jgi:hypothetical protein
VTFDNFEITGACSSFASSGANPGMIAPGSNNFVSNLYCHGWTMPSTAHDIYACATYSGSGNQIIWDHDTFDGSDAPNWPAGNANCKMQSGVPCATGGGIYDRAYIIRYCVFRYLHYMAITTDTISAHDNLWEYLEWPPESAMVNAQHADTLMVYSGTGLSFYNNVTRHNPVTELIYFNVNSGGTLHIFNNVFYDNLKYDGGDAAPDNCINLAAQTSGGNQTLYIYNNTFDMDTDDSTGGGCQIGIYGTSSGNSYGYTWSGNVYTGNNHLIGYSSINNLFVTRSGGATYNIVQNGGDLIQATATARSQGYVQSTSPVGDRPTSGSGSTVGSGTNYSSSCSTFSSDSYLCSGTSGGPTESGGVHTFPAVEMNPRGSSWDAGAYQFSANAGPNPPTALKAVVQ